MTKRIVIIGGGPAGYEAALAGAKYGADITLVEDQGLGGAAVIHDCVPSKSFIAATGIATDLRRVDDMGFQRPEVAGKLLELEAVFFPVLVGSWANSIQGKDFFFRPVFEVSS